MEKHELLQEESTVSRKKERSKDPRFDILKTIIHNPKKVTLEDVETGEIKTSASIYKAGKFIDHCPRTIVNWNGRTWKNKYKINILILL